MTKMTHTTKAATDYPQLGAAIQMKELTDNINNFREKF
jgi:hypothetical protein